MKHHSHAIRRGPHVFSNVPKAQIERSSFDRSFGHKTTFNEGYLVPVMVDEALPGDTYNVSMTAFARFTTPLKPIMDNLYMDVFFFAVPYRLVWQDWQKFCGEQTNPGDSTSFVIPQSVSPAGGYLLDSVQDHMGLPTGIAGFSHSSLPLRAYNLIYNQWFRDENLCTSVPTQIDDGPDAPANYVLKRRGKRHDYFTSCLPWPQKGTAVNLPLGTSAPVELATTLNIQPQVRSAVTHAINAGVTSLGSDGAGLLVNNLAGAVVLDPNGTLIADLTNATAATINSLRQAFQVQRMYERDARGGTRYIEILKSHFGVTSPDMRLQRPEYLGGSSSPIHFHPVPATGGGTFVGVGFASLAQVGAFGTCSYSGSGFTKSFVEHCIIIGLVCVRADINYQQGLDRMWSRSTRFDFYWPALSHLGEQAVLNKEIFCNADANDSLVFGYQERYAEYRYKPSYITGQFRSTTATPLDVWHLAQKFTSVPLLNQTFIEENAPVSRVVAVTTEPHFYFDSFFKMKCARPMPVYSVPGMIDHF